jgi:NAD(P)-dependent dehydrogenase (short-subunit alcohol dehydrogenase family)
VTSWQESNDLVQTAIDRFGHLDILVNSLNDDPAFQGRMISEIGKEEWESVQQSRLKDSFLCTRAAVPHMRKQRQGRLIYFVSPQALIGAGGQAHCGAAQMAVAGLGRNAAIELERYHVTSNCVVHCIRRDATSEAADVAPLVVFLASDAARSLTGQVFGVQDKEILLLSQARIQRSMHNSEGWTVESLSEMFESTMRPYFTPLDPS